MCAHARQAFGESSRGVVMHRARAAISGTALRLPPSTPPTLRKTPAMPLALHTQEPQTRTDHAHLTAPPATCSSRNAAGRRRAGARIPPAPTRTPAVEQNAPKKRAGNGASRLFCPPPSMATLPVLAPCSPLRTADYLTPNQAQSIEADLLGTAALLCGALSRISRIFDQGRPCPAKARARHRA